VVVVKRHFLDSHSQGNEAISGFKGAFPGLQVVLIGQDASRRATYFGRRDVVNFLSMSITQVEHRLRSGSVISAPTTAPTVIV
jgi:hypothetical protein